MFKKKFSKKATGIIVGAFVLTCAAIGGITASACNSCGNNWMDLEFIFKFADSSDQQNTSPRMKSDTSKIYMKCNATAADFYVKPFGVDNNGKHIDCSYGNTVAGNGACISRGTTIYLQSLVKEKGYDRVSLHATASAGTGSYNALGVWSPDNFNHK